jgi:hypothetical protein
MFWQSFVFKRNMAKKKTKRRPTAGAEKKRKPGDAPPRESEEDRPFDMGGLPNRDLKKNLGGCG